VNRDTERAAQEIVRKASADRPRPTRSMWIAALVVGVVCLASLAIGFATAEREPTQMPQLGSGVRRPIHATSHGYSGVFVIGAVSIIIASLVVARRRRL
jgi:hypothetical protein